MSRMERLESKNVQSEGIRQHKVEKGNSDQGETLLLQTLPGSPPDHSPGPEPVPRSPSASLQKINNQRDIFFSLEVTQEVVQ